MPPPVRELLARYPMVSGPTSMARKPCASRSSSNSRSSFQKVRNFLTALFSSLLFLFELDRTVSLHLVQEMRRGDELGNGWLLGQDVKNIGILHEIAQNVSVESGGIFLPQSRRDFDDGLMHLPFLKKFGSVGGHKIPHIPSQGIHTSRGLRRVQIHIQLLCLSRQHRNVVRTICFAKIFHRHLDGPRRIKKESLVPPFLRLLPHGKVPECCLFACFVGNCKSTAVLMQRPKNHGPFTVHPSRNGALPFDTLGVSRLYGVGRVPCRLVVVIKHSAPLGDGRKFFARRRLKLLGSRRR